MSALRNGLLSGLIVAAAMAPIRVVAQPPAAPQAATTARTIRGTLPNDGGPYSIVVPANWNGVVVLDLDHVAAGDSEFYRRLYALGFAGAGTTRGTRPSRGTAVDNPLRIGRQLQVLDIIEREVGRPRRVITFGLSGAGGLAVAMLEAAPQRIAGAVGGCMIAGAPSWFNAKLDAAFVARTLIAPDSDLLLENIPHDVTGPSRAWLEMLNRAQATDQGRARIALATAIGQLPTWTNPARPEPAPDDVAQVQQAMFETLANQFSDTLGAALLVRRDFEESAGGPISWNAGVDYRRSFANADLAQQRVVRRLYQAAGLDLDADLARLARAPRLAANPSAVADANRRMGVSARPRNPVLLMHTSGDALAQVATIEPYLRRAPRALARAVVTRNTGHCTFSIGERIAVITALIERIETGSWPDLAPAAMNRRAQGLDPAEARFMTYGFRPFNRPFYSDDVYRPR